MKIKNLEYLTLAKLKDLAVAVATAVAVTAFGIYGSTITPKTAYSGNTATQRLTLRVLPIRSVGLDPEGNINYILSNTPTIAEERVQVFQGGVEIPMTDEIRRQYYKVLRETDLSKSGIYHISNEPSTEEAGKTLGGLEGDVYSNIMGGVRNIPVSAKEVLDNVLELNLQSGKEGYSLRTTIYEKPDGLVGITVERSPF